MNADLRHERAERGHELFRMVNQQIDELNGEFGADDEVREYVCECLDTSCAERLSLPHDEYQRIRRNRTEFILIPGHEHPQVEEVVDRTDRWVIVRKLSGDAQVDG